MKLTRGGAQVIAEPEPSKPVGFVGNIEPLTHSLWESMIDMQEQRRLAWEAWERVLKLQEKLERNPDGPKAVKILARTELVSYLVREHQWKFLVLEEDANRRWQQLSVEQREEQGLPEMFGIDAKEPGMLGAWYRVIGTQKPKRFPIDPIMFRFIEPEHVNAYQGRTSWLNSDTVPDSALRRRRG